MAQATLVKRGAYHDSVALLTLARALRARSGVREAAVVMGTPANRDLRLRRRRGPRRARRGGST